jgi:hypothetical protein
MAERIDNKSFETYASKQAFREKVWIMYTQFVDIVARQHIAELHAEAEHRRLLRHGRLTRRPSLRTRLGRLLLRWGHRLAPTPRVATSRGRPATMGP